MSHGEQHDGTSDATGSVVIPDDLASCQAMLQRLADVNATQSTDIAKLSTEVSRLGAYTEQLEAIVGEGQATIERLQLEIDEMMREALRRRSERYINNPDQLRLDFGDTNEAADAASGLAMAVEESRSKEPETVVVPEHRRRRGREGRQGTFPEHLPRRETIIDAPPTVTTCTEHGERRLIGYDTTETLEMTPPKLVVHVRKYPKYICDEHADCGVGSPPRIEGLVEGDRFDTSVAAQIVTAKYGYHMPLYREQDYFASCGWTPSRSTLLNVLTSVAALIAPLIEHFRRALIASGKLGLDDTRLSLLMAHGPPPPDKVDPKSRRIREVFEEAERKGEKSITARMWAYRGITVPLNVFDFTVSRHRDGPVRMLADFQGTILGDCYSGFEAIVVRSDGTIVRAACNSHARRKVYDARGNYPTEASLLLGQYQRLYDIEDRGAVLDPTARRELRQAESRPIWDEMLAWIDGPEAAKVVPKSVLAQALRYIDNHRDELRVYLGDGALPIDNNLVEQLMRFIALGRKNWMFVGSIAAGERAADLMTLVSGAVRNDLDVYAYVKDVLDQLLAGCKDYESLRPDVWGRAHPESIREYRREERRDRADRKSRTRAARRARATLAQAQAQAQAGAAPAANAAASRPGP